MPHAPQRNKQKKGNACRKRHPDKRGEPDSNIKMTGAPVWRSTCGCKPRICTTCWGVFAELTWLQAGNVREDAKERTTISDAVPN